MRTAALDGPAIGAVLLRRKWSILLSGFVAAALAVLVIQALPRKYSAEGGLVVESQQLNLPELTGAANPSSSGNSDAVATAVAILQSRGTLQSVVADLDLAHEKSLQPALRMPAILAAHPDIAGALAGAASALRGLLPHANDEDASNPAVRDANAEETALTYLQRHLKVGTTEHSNLVTIAFEAGSPDLAAQVVNSVMTNYIAQDAAAKRAQLQQANEWLTKRASDLRAEVDADDQKIATFLQQHQIGQTQGGSVAAVQLTAAKERLAAAQENLAQLQSSLDAARSSGGGGASSQVLASPLILALRQREADIMARLAGLPPNHPDRAKLEEEARSIRGQLASGTDKIIASLNRDTQAARLSVQQQQQAVNKAEQDSLAAGVARAQYDQLLHDADAKRQVYNAFMARADQTRLASMQFPTARVEFKALPPTRPDRASAVMILLLGFVGGAVLAAAVTLLRQMTSSRLLSTWDVAMATGLPVFGSVPEVKLAGADGGRLSLLRAPRPQPAVEETLRAAWLAMRSMTPEDESVTVVVTSSEVGEGKTTVAAALARRTAADGFRVLLIDADLRRPALASSLRLQPTADLEAVLSGAIDVKNAIVEDPTCGLHCLLNDRPVGNPMKILASKEVKTLLAETSRAYDLVVMDSPPVMRVSDAVLLSQSSLFTLFAVAHGRISGDIVAEAISRFPQDRQARILTVLTRVPRSRMDARDHYGGYGNATRDVAPKKTGRRSGRRYLPAPMGKAADRGMVGLD